MEQSSCLLRITRVQVSSSTPECVCRSNDSHCHKKLIYFMFQKKIKWYLANKEKGYITFYWNVLEGTYLKELPCFSGVLACSD